MLHEYHVTYSVRYYPRFHVTAVGLGTYYPRIQGSACTFIYLLTAVLILTTVKPLLAPFIW